MYMPCGAEWLAVVVGVDSVYIQLLEIHVIITPQSYRLIDRIYIIDCLLFSLVQLRYPKRQGDPLHRH